MYRRNSPPLPRDKPRTRARFTVKARSHGKEAETGKFHNVPETTLPLLYPLMVSVDEFGNDKRRPPMAQTGIGPALLSPVRS
jgi:hypothetical protein